MLPVLMRHLNSLNYFSLGIESLWTQAIHVWLDFIDSDNFQGQRSVNVLKYSSFTKLWQSYSDPHPKISPIAIFAFYSLNYSLVACLQDNSRPNLPTKVETKRKLQQFTVSGWLIINGGESGSEQIKMSD